MEQISSIFLETGILGAVVIVLSIVVVYQNRKVDNKSDIISQLHREIAELQEKWRNSETERADRLMDIASTTSAVQSALVEKIEVGRGQR